MRDPECLSKLIEIYKEYLEKLVFKYPLDKQQREEAYNCTIVGFLSAVDKYDVNQDVELMTFAYRRIEKEIYEFIKFEISTKKTRFYVVKGNEDICIEKLSCDLMLDLEDEEDIIKQVEDKVFMEQTLNKLNKEDKKLIKDIYLNQEKISNIAQGNKMEQRRLYQRKRTIIAGLRKGELNQCCNF